MKFSKIIRSGIPGSGNTYVRQVLEYLVGKDNVIGTHSYLKGDNTVGIIIPYRDFRSVLASMLRKNKLYTNRATIRLVYETSFYNAYNAIKSYKYHYKYPQNILWLQYIKFFNDVNYLLDRLQQFLAIKISASDQKYIEKHFSLKANKCIADRLESWETMDQESRIHGFHIGTDKPDSWKDFFSKKMQLHITELLKDELKRWEFEL